MTSEAEGPFHNSQWCSHPLHCTLFRLNSLPMMSLNPKWPLRMHAIEKFQEICAARREWSLCSSLCSWWAPRFFSIPSCITHQTPLMMTDMNQSRWYQQSSLPQKAVLFNGKVQETGSDWLSCQLLQRLVDSSCFNGLECLSFIPCYKLVDDSCVCIKPGIEFFCRHLRIPCQDRCEMCHDSSPSYSRNDHACRWLRNLPILLETKKSYSIQKIREKATCEPKRLLF